jgi:hypothetical protein
MLELDAEATSLGIDTSEHETVLSIDRGFWVEKRWRMQLLKFL